MTRKLRTGPIFREVAFGIAFVTLVTTAAPATTYVRCPSCAHVAMTVPAHVLAEVSPVTTPVSARGRVIQCGRCRLRLEIVEHAIP